MPWIKRNLVFVISLAVALLLIGAGTFYIFSSKESADTASAELESKKGEYDQLVQRDPYPNSKNIELAKSEQIRLSALRSNILQTFSQYPKSEALDDASFKALLSRVIAELEREADRKGVKLPAPSGSSTKYNFTFDTQRRELRLAPNTLQPLALALNDIKDVCQLLFASKIHSLVSIRRTAIGTNEIAGSGDLLAKKVSTNAIVKAGVYPYEVQFQCFTSELDDVFNRLVAAPNAYVIKVVNIERGSASDDSAASAAPLAAVNPMQAMMARYGRMMPQPQAVPAAAATAGKIGEVVLEQKPIKVTLGIEVVRLIPEPETSTGNSSRTRRQEPKL
jgi:hypothetical protein